ncbi:facilitated trehalose transporter Tret1-like [Anoplophora glabripennis]|uniref:facilitated trehalose transporter Tret1-like n=1 Tax=Anoplophora glabripennis TaxID=217634 RepID=UPI000874E567|nr:facilitated trehalose transporter Tret1-like [Anoplophora glabripennis]
MTLPVIKTILEGQGSAKLLQYLACTSACVVVFTVGIHLAWTGPSLRKILSPEYPHDVTPDEASYIAIVSCVGHVIGGFSGSTLSDTMGRKYTLLAAAVPQVSSFIMIYFSYYGTYLLYCARVIGGIGEGVVVAVLPTYLAEVSSPNIRGAIGTLSTLFARSGCLFINLLGSYTDIHTAALVCLAFPVLHWVLFVNFPETPYYLLMKGKTERARQSLKALRGSQDVEKEVLRLTADVARQMSESGTYKDLFTIDSNRKAFFLITAARIFQQFTGTSAFINYYQILIEQNTDLSPVMGSSLIILTQIIMSALASKFVDRFGRKPLLTASAGLTFSVLLILGIYFTLKDYTSLDLSVIHWFPLPMMVLFIITFFLGMGVIMPILVSEVYSTSIKARAISLGGIVFASSMTASTKFYQYAGDNFGLAVPFYTFAASTFFGTLFFHFKVPETKGKTLEAIQQELKGNVGKNRQSMT